LIYFDHNASTPVRPEVLAAMISALAELHANPSSAHREGQRARAAIERAREQVATLVHARPRRIAISALEHHAVHGAAQVLERGGFAIEHVPATPAGTVDPRALDSLPADTTLVSVMLANNETGAIQPVSELVARARCRGMRVHCDAVQAAAKIPIDVASLGADYLVISAHKIGGPKGVGALIVRDGAPYEPLFRGSGHERGRRGGTENLAGIVGLGVAAELAARDLDPERARLLALRDRLERGLKAALPDRLPNTVNVSVPGARSDHLLMSLDARGVEVSAGAACASGAVEPSPVLAAMGVPRELAVCAIRLSMGRTTTPAEVDAVIAAFAESARAARALAGAALKGEGGA